MNADGKPDLLTANQSDNTVGVLLGTGTDSFSPVTTFSAGAGSYANALAVADVNRDGRPDLLTANYGSGTAVVLLGTGTYTPLGVAGSTASAGLALFPSPTPHGAATLTGAAPGQAVRVLDTRGRVAATATADATGTAALLGLAPGLYLVRVGAATARLAVE